MIMPFHQETRLEDDKYNEEEGESVLIPGIPVDRLLAETKLRTRSD
jgi:hypothetical protein